MWVCFLHCRFLEVRRQKRVKGVCFIWHKLSLKHTDALRFLVVLFIHTKTTQQAGEGRRRGEIVNRRHCAFCLSSFPCRLAYCTVLYAHTHAWLAVSARAMQREGCSEHRQASTGHQPSTVDTNWFTGGKTECHGRWMLMCLFIFAK